MAYITLAQVKERMPSSYNGNDDIALTDILNSCCTFLDRYCGRASGGFGVQTYDELYQGSGDRLLFLRNYPIQSIAKIATTPLPALWIRNNDGDMGARATVQINGTWTGQDEALTSTGITLTYVTGGNTSTNTLTWASYSTVTALVNAINAIGSNWQAGVSGGFGNWSSSDLRATQGAFGCRVTTAYLWIHWFDLPWYRVNEMTGEISSPWGFQRGNDTIFSWRVVYSAGYPTFPYDLTQALAELVVATYYAREVNANMSAENLGGYSYTQQVEKTFDGLSLVAKKTIQGYKRRTVPHWSIW